MLCAQRALLLSTPRVPRHRRLLSIMAQSGSSSTAVGTAPVVLVHDSQVVPCEATSGQWLATAPRGAYTTARTVQGNLVFKLSSHIQRLATSANLMIDADMRVSQSVSSCRLSSAPPSRCW
jgi:hypothetical protein